MATAERTCAEQRIVMHGVSWRTYQSLLADRGERGSPRMSYDQGSLELMSPSDEHERYKKRLGYMIVFWALENGIPLASLGSTTFLRKEQRRGLEPDECYYIQHESLVRGKLGIDLSVDPPPDLVVEVDVSSKSLRKLRLYAGLQIPEVWRFDREALTVHELHADGLYAVRPDSVQLPGFPTSETGQWISRAETMDEMSWLRSFQDWARQRGEQTGG
ncbi:MAG TPA: Uma2 family endonuclease [Pirellulales bacterium]|jgi:Uma2 family endonuclease|nr:Uma2 family endonuclease [Pirellulales bacterium]